MEIEAIKNQFLKIQSSNHWDIILHDIFVTLLWQYTAMLISFYLIIVRNVSILKHKKIKAKNIKYLPYFTGILHNIPPNLHDITASSAVNIFKDWNNAAILTIELMLRSTIIVSLRYLETFSFKLFEVTWKRNCCRSSVHDHCQKCYCSQ